MAKKGSFDITEFGDMTLAKKGSFDITEFSLAKKGSFDITEFRSSGLDGGSDGKPQDSAALKLKPGGSFQADDAIFI